MALSKIRRILIAIVGLLLFLNLAALGVAKFGKPGDQAEARKVDVIAWTEKPEVATAARTELEAAGHRVTLTQTQREHKVPNGYRLVMKGDKDMLASVRDTLVYKKLPVKLVAGGAELQYGNVFPDKSKAEAQAKRVKNSEKMTFTVVENHRTVKKPAQKLVVSGLDEKTGEEIVGSLRDKGMDVESQPVAPAEPGEAG